MPEGFALGLHIGLRGPAFLFTTFPSKWMNYYTSNGLQLRDPAVAWSLTHTGFIRWRDLRDNDPANVMGLAADHGLTHGATMAVFENGSRSVFGCFRKDRELLDAELNAVREPVTALHNLTVGQRELPADLEEDLKRMSIRLSHG